ncbi:unnamed protein product [Zymoseptoria tritici ST99CH_1E4]|uniref:Uncharacterized protein n=1 Tax=Zymoseptoria tritici ST99CH_1E4 TaxID=1276532 RepID=A0A2H1G5Y4_ZYMTR|nr:unnamed protein product [Zymoseptoria tritici ST99CH_1E4]
MDMDTDTLYEEAPPRYSSLSAPPESFKIATCTHDPPPTTRWFVRSAKEPPAWKLLTGPLMSNATTQPNLDPCHKRRYRVMYPPCYEDVFLHKSPWTKTADALPRYHVELYGRDRYEPEPIIILGPASTSDDESANLQIDTKAIAIRHLPRVVSTLASQIAGMRRYIAFVQSEFWSWDWRCKNPAANHDMRAMITRAKKECAKSASLIEKLVDFLKFVGQSGKVYDKTVIQYRRSVREASGKLKRLRL